MKFLILISLMVIASTSADTVHVDELEDYVTSRDDKNELKRLDDDDYMIRSDKQRRLEEILARQPPNVQQQYRQAVQLDQAREEQKRQVWFQRMQQQGLSDYASQLLAIDDDMSISEADAKQRKQQLKRQLFIANPMAAFNGLDYDDDLGD
ncbi:unnamed protein product [Haemonchus placei]|uniref:Uncharacterized protein n=1 Tax=Haemonchus placei TaxID=6290 RepID=A0A0N4WWM6_HAEPC|nr:unnamed protein product [Haemonchus placei]